MRIAYAFACCLILLVFFAYFFYLCKCYHIMVNKDVYITAATFASLSLHHNHNYNEVFV